MKIYNNKKIISHKKNLEDNKNKSDKTKSNIQITYYRGEWDKTQVLPELNPYEDENGLLYTEGENEGRLTNFICSDIKDEKGNNKALKDELLDQIKEQLSLAFPDNTKLMNQSMLEQYLDQEDIFCYINSNEFIERPEYIQYLENYVEGYDDRICLIKAKAGLGKTMLLSRIAIICQGKYDKKRVYKRFCGVSDLTLDVYSLWKSILDEAGVNEDENFYPKNLDELERNFSQILNIIASKGECIIIIDAINQMKYGLDMLN